MNVDLSNRTAIVTGSTGGIGLAIARGLSEAGATVVITGRRQDRVDMALAALRGTKAGAQASGVAADTGTSAGCETLTQGKTS